MSSIKFPHSSGNSMSIAAPASNPASNLTLTLPTTIGSNGQNMKVDGSGNLGWVTPGADPNSSLSVTYQTSDISGATNYDLVLPSNCYQVNFKGWNLSTSGSGNPGFYVGVDPSGTGVLSSSNYKYSSVKFGNSSAGANNFSGSNAIYLGDYLGSAAGDTYWTHAQFARSGDTDSWTFEILSTEYESNVLQMVYGYVDTSDPITRIRLTPIGTGWDSGEFTWEAWSTA
jgi:hypothetical protein